MRLHRTALFVAASMLMSSCAVLGFTTGCDGTQLIAEFEQVGDLVENANVQSQDVEIGTVQQIELDGWNARVTMCINGDENLPRDSELVVRTTSLLGEKFVDFQANTDDPPFFEDGDVVGIDQTSKATELEEVFARLASILGTGNLENINRFTTAQATILRNRSGEVREVLHRLRRFTDVLNGRRNQIASSIDSLDSVAKTVLDDSRVLEDFLVSFADSSEVLADQKEGLQDLLISLDRFSNVSVQLLRSTESGLDQQFDDLRPILRTIVNNSENLEETLQTLATFSQWFPETMPGDYLQLDVCQAAPDSFGQGNTCPQSITRDQPGRSAAAEDDNAVRHLLRVDEIGGSR